MSRANNTIYKVSCWLPQAVGDAEANFDLIMKDGVIYKNTLQ